MCPDFSSLSIRRGEESDGLSIFLFSNKAPFCQTFVSKGCQIIKASCKERKMKRMQGERKTGV